MDFLSELVFSSEGKEKTMPGLFIPLREKVFLEY